MNTSLTEQIVGEIKKISKELVSIDTILNSEYYPETVKIKFGFEDAEEAYIQEEISLHASVYRNALEDQKEYLLNLFENKKLQLIEEINAL